MAELVKITPIVIYKQSFLEVRSSKVENTKVLRKIYVHI